MTVPVILQGLFPVSICATHHVIRAKSALLLKGFVASHAPTNLTSLSNTPPEVKCAGVALYSVQSAPSSRSVTPAVPNVAVGVEITEGEMVPETVFDLDAAPLGTVVTEMTDVRDALTQAETLTVGVNRADADGDLETVGDDEEVLEMKDDDESDGVAVKDRATDIVMKPVLEGFLDAVTYDDADEVLFAEPDTELFTVTVSVMVAE